MGFRDLDVYRRAHQLALDVHKESLTFPSFEMHELGSQMRRASKGICLNIAEGYGRRRYQKDYGKFLVSALSSVEETQACLDFALHLGYLSEERYNRYSTEYDILGKQLSAFLSRFVPVASGQTLEASTGD